MKHIGMFLLLWCLVLSVFACFLILYFVDASIMTKEEGFRSFVGLFLSIGGIIGSVVGLKYLDKE